MRNIHKYPVTNKESLAFLERIKEEKSKYIEETKLIGCMDVLIIDYIIDKLKSE